MKVALICGFLVVADASVQSFGGDPSLFAAAAIRSGGVRAGPVGIKSAARRRPRDGSRFHAPLVVDDISSGDVSVIVEQTQSVYPQAAKKPKNQVYVPPRWVKGDYGVEILEPGRWIDDPDRER
jgi:hypothetical protein